MSPHQGLEPTVRPEEAAQARARALALQRYTSALNRAVTPADVAAVAVNEGRVLAAADGAAVGLVVGDRLQLSSSSGREMRIQGVYRDLPLDADTPMTGAAVTGEPVFAGSSDELLERYRMLAMHGLDPAFESRAIVPLAVDERSLGVLVLTYAQEGLLSGEREQLFIRSVADLAAQSLHRAMLFAREAQARRDAVAAAERTARLQRVTAQLADTETADDVLRVLAQELVGAIPGSRAFVYLVDPEGIALTTPNAPGAERPDARFFTLPVSASSPVTDAFRLRRPLWFASYEEYRARYPDFPETEVDRTGGFGCLPLSAFGHDLGVLVVHVEGAGTPEPADRSLAEAIAAQGGLALERAGQRERAARAAARIARLRDLAEGLSGARDTDEIANVLLERGLSGFGATTTFVAQQTGDDASRILDVDGPAEVAVQALVTAVPSPAADALANDDPVVLEDRSSIADSYPHLVSAIDGDGVEALACLPAGQSLAVLGLLWDRSHEVDEDELDLLASIAHHAEQALQRARFYEDAQDAAARLVRLHEASEALSAAVTADDVCRIAIERGVGAVGGVSAVALLLSDGVLHPVEAGVYGEAPAAGDRRVSDATLARAHRVVRSGEPLWVLGGSDENAAHVPHPTPVTLAPEAFLPMVGNGRVHGVLTIAFPHGAYLGQADRDLLLTLARQCGETIARASLLEAEGRARDAADQARRRTERLQAATARLARELDPAEVADAVLREAASALGADGGTLGVPSVEERRLDIVGAQGFGERVRAQRAWLGFDERALMSAAYEAAVPMWVSSPEEWERRFPDGAHLFSGDAGAAMGIPLVFEERVVGVMVLLFARARTPSLDDLSVAESLGEQAAQALERGRLYEAERKARGRAAFLQRVSAAFATAATGDEIGQAVVTHGREALGADQVVMVFVDEEASNGPGLTPAAVAGDETTGFTLHPASLTGSSIERLAVDARTVVVVDDTEAPGDGAPILPPGLSSAIAVPIVERGHVLGVVSFSFKSVHRFDPDTVSLLETVARLTGQALERARRYESEREVTAALQRSLLPQRFAPIEGVSLAVRYLAAGGDRVEIGGDWFDLVSRPDGTVLFAVGDVVGRGLAAATTMGQLRSAFRTIAMTGLRPSQTLTLLDGFAATLGAGGAMATVVCIQLDPRDGHGLLSSAGHPPPVLVDDGDARLIDGGRAVPLGLEMEGVERTDVELWLPAGAALLLYTDGLVERRGMTLDEGFDRLVSVAASAPRDPEPMCDRLLEQLLPPGGIPDDVALLSVRRDPPDLVSLQHRFRARPQELGTARERVRDVLASAGAHAGTVDDIILATNEAAANAVEHGSRSSDDEVEIEIRVDGDLVLVIVRDNGRWREARPDPTRGRGFALMRAVMQSVRVDHGAAGTTVTMSRVLGDG